VTIGLDAHPEELDVADPVSSDGCLESDQSREERRSDALARVSEAKVADLLRNMRQGRRWYSL
jgi:hypothetical protein